MTPILISILVGTGGGLLVWYGWAFSENVRASRARRQANAAEGDKEEANGPAGT